MKTELEKMNDVHERSQAIGEFFEWLLSSKNYSIARCLTDEEEENGELPEYALMPVHINMEELLAEFFEIDLIKAEKERSELLEQIRETYQAE